MQIHIYEGTEIMKRKLDLSLDFFVYFLYFYVLREFCVF